MFKFRKRRSAPEPAVEPPARKPESPLNGVAMLDDRGRPAGLERSDTPGPFILRLRYGEEEYSFRVLRGSHRLGRTPAADALFGLDCARRISRQQAELICQDDRLFIRALSKVSDTFVNGERLELEAEPRELRAGDEIAFSRLTFVVQFSDILRPY